MDPLVLEQLAPHGVLRVAINLANYLLVGPNDAQGNLTGIGPAFARMIASRLGVPCACVPYTSPSALADAAGRDAWDICLIGADPARAQTISFTSAWLEIDATCLVRSESPLASAQEFDREGMTIGAAAGSAYELWLTRHARHAQLVRMPTHEAACEVFAQAKVDALAGLRPYLLADEERLAGVKLLEGCFTSIQQAVGTHRRNERGVTFLEGVVEEARDAGLIDELIECYQVRGVRGASQPFSAN